MKAKVEIDSVFRMHRMKDKKKEPTYKMGVVFRSNTLPTDVSIYSVIHRVQPYIRKPIICFKCLRYNHLSKNCKEKKEKCMNCATEHSQENLCNILKCMYCFNANHKTTDKVCPRWKKENDIQAIMAKKCLTYQEAKQYFEIPTENFFDVLRTTEDYPTPAEAYSKVAANGKNFPQHLQQNRKEWSYDDKRNRTRKENRTPNQSHVDVEIVPGVASILGLNQKEFTKKRKMEEEKEEPRGIGLFNKYRAGELERFKKEIEESVKKQSFEEWKQIISSINIKLEAIVKSHGKTGGDISACIMGELNKMVGSPGDK
ncbi:uncharacterized protein LOC129738584 isoform X2 [Uranotaenia lowii]|uniref:uncharacterized protein LOC129738584 isoform X2 n=1 Tax=Uranotaenia lowii TaxID=190385 RepID=UPI0024796B5B|nr:uncharacterized protein LOC129738584 isoform X2 [Uranotaenia lowii]